MDISFDARKREKNLVERGLDFADAALVFAGDTLDEVDDRIDYGEQRTITVGALRESVVVIVWTERDGKRRVISMRKASRDERENYWRHVDRP